LSGASNPELDLSALSGGFPALTSAAGTFLSEAAAVCLHMQGHDERCSLEVTGTYPAVCFVVRPQVTGTMRSCYRDPKRATENGAYGIAILLMQKLAGYTAVEQSITTTGVDYWLSNDDELAYMNARLEVSGLLSGTDSQVKYRMKQKLAQTVPSDSTGLPAFAAIVEFGQPRAQVVRKP
jgi:hypothetical protein